MVRLFTQQPCAETEKAHRGLYYEESMFRETPENNEIIQLQ